jgi:ribonuclease HI
MRVHKDYLAIIEVSNMEQLMANYFLHTNRKIHPDEYFLQIESVLAKDLVNVGLGIVLYKNGVQIWGKSMIVSDMSELEASYSGIILGLEEAVEQGIMDIVVGGSGLAIKQMGGNKCGEYQFGSDQGFRYYLQTRELSKMFSNIRFREVKGEKGGAFEMAKGIGKLYGY